MNKRGGFCSTSLLVCVAALVVVALLLIHLNGVAVVVAAVTIVSLLMVMCGPVPRLLSRALQDEFFQDQQLNLGAKNVVVILGDFTVKPDESSEAIPTVFAYSRISKSAELYQTAKKAGVECRVLIAGDDSVRDGITTTSVYARRLMLLGVEKADVFVEPAAFNSYAHAKITKQTLAGWDYDKLFLVTSGLHLKRAAVYFGHFGLAPTLVAADYTKAPVSFVPLSYNLLLTDIAIHQYIGLARLTIYNRLGWNK